MFSASPSFPRGEEEGSVGPPIGRFIPVARTGRVEYLGWSSFSSRASRLALPLRSGLSRFLGSDSPRGLNP